MTQQLTIPRYRLVDQAPEKAHYVYVIELVVFGQHYTIEKRYSVFHSLHRQLRKNFSTPLFPPKRIRSFQPKILDRRRQTLENYLQTMLKYGPSRAQVLSFLGIQRPQGSSTESLDEPPEEKILDHQPIYQFVKDPFLEPAKSNDVVTRGVLLALFGRTNFS